LLDSIILEPVRKCKHPVFDFIPLLVELVERRGCNTKIPTDTPKGNVGGDDFVYSVILRGN